MTEYKKGDRVRFDAEGEVTHVYNSGTLEVKWPNGRVDNIPFDSPYLSKVTPPLPTEPGLYVRADDDALWAYICVLGKDGNWYDYDGELLDEDSLESLRSVGVVRLVRADTDA